MRTLSLLLVGPVSFAISFSIGTAFGTTAQLIAAAPIILGAAAWGAYVAYKDW